MFSAAKLDETAVAAGLTTVSTEQMTEQVATQMPESVLNDSRSLGAVIWTAMPCVSTKYVYVYNACESRIKFSDRECLCHLF